MNDIVTRAKSLLDPDKWIEWLRAQPADGEYVWSDPAFCLMGHYLADHGSQWGDVQYSDMPAYEEIAKPKPWTFGAALERAEALKALPAPSMPLIEQHRADVPLLEGAVA